MEKILLNLFRYITVTYLALFNKNPQKNRPESLFKPQYFPRDSKLQDAAAVHALSTPKLGPAGPRVSGVPLELGAHTWPNKAHLGSATDLMMSCFNCWQIGNCRCHVFAIRASAPCFSFIFPFWGFLCFARWHNDFNFRLIRKKIIRLLWCVITFM